MADRKYICAFTALHNNYPEYMNVTQYGDEMEVTLREAAKEEGKEGRTISVRIPAVLFGLMLEEANKNFGGNGS